MIPFLVALVSFSAACGGGVGDPPVSSDSGIRGTVSAGPQCPVVQAGSPCPDVPWDGRIHFTGDGVDVEIATFDGGSFSIAIAPGTYQVQPVVEGSIPPSAASQTVVVPSQGYVDITLTVDTGIR
ncbi:MAG: hypothetical protein ABI572_04305 [Actinomycetota bacterium]